MLLLDAAEAARLGLIDRPPRRKGAGEPSPWEPAFDRIVRALALPEPVRAYRFHPPRKWEFDRAWPDRRLAVEVEGFGHHDLNRYTRDVEKYNRAALDGWALLRVTPAMIQSGAVMALLEEAFGLSAPVRCPTAR